VRQAFLEMRWGVVNPMSDFEDEFEEDHPDTSGIWRN
jgi:hypothetical protein